MQLGYDSALEEDAIALEAERELLALERAYKTLEEEALSSEDTPDAALAPDAVAAVPAPAAAADPAPSAPAAPGNPALDNED